LFKDKNTKGKKFPIIIAKVSIFFGWIFDILIWFINFSN
jgi:hypothetical protein